MILVFILFNFLSVVLASELSVLRTHFWLFIEVVRNIPGEVTRKSDGPTNRPRVKTTAQGLRAS